MGNYVVAETTGLRVPPCGTGRDGAAPPTTRRRRSWASECPNGVAKVETQHTFLNMLANILTGGIYSPMSITVTCAAGSMEEAAAEAPVVDARGSDAESIAAALDEAALRSWERQGPVYIRAVD